MKRIAALVSAARHGGCFAGYGGGWARLRPAVRRDAIRQSRCAQKCEKSQSDCAGRDTCPIQNMLVARRSCDVGGLNCSRTPWPGSPGKCESVGGNPGRPESAESHFARPATRTRAAGGEGCGDGPPPEPPKAKPGHDSSSDCIVAARESSFMDNSSYPRYCGPVSHRRLLSMT
jgi:hypothetical protein